MFWAISWLNRRPCARPQACAPPAVVKSGMVVMDDPCVSDRGTRGLLCKPFDVGSVVAKIVLEPDCEGTRVLLDAPANLIAGQQGNVDDLGRVGPRLG